MSNPTGPGVFFIYSGGEFQNADVARYFSGKAKSADDIVDVITAEGYEPMTRKEVDAGEVRFSLWEGPGHQCVVRISSAGVPPHFIYLDGLLNWLQFQGAIFAPAIGVANFVHGDA
jgi:hypothetical protein